MNIVEIKNDKYTAKINLSRGGNCISLYNSEWGAHILREPDYANLDNPFLYGMPILFPVNRISGAKFLFEGREYPFPVNEPETGCHLHGTLHQEPFLMESQTENSIRCSYRSYGKYQTFPHDFKITLEYQVTDEGLLHTTTITNLSETNMPCLFGFHTTFSLPFIAETQPEHVYLQTEVSEEIERNMANYLPTGSLLPADDITSALKNGTFQPLKTKLSRHYHCDARQTKMVLYDREKHLRVIYENDEKFDYRLIYNGDANGFICLEPQNAFVNALNTALPEGLKGFDFIKPGDSKIYHSKIALQATDL